MLLKSHTRFTHKLNEDQSDGNANGGGLPATITPEDLQPVDEIDISDILAGTPEEGSPSSSEEAEDDAAYKDADNEEAGGNSGSEEDVDSGEDLDVEEDVDDKEGSEDDVEGSDDEDEDEEGEDEEGDKKEETKASSKFANFLKKKEQKLREKESKFEKEREEFLKAKEELDAYAESEEFKKANGILRNLKDGKISTLLRDIGVDEFNLLKHYGIEDTEQAKKLIEKADAKAQQEALEKQRMDLEKQRQQQQVFSDVSDITIQNIGNYDSLKHFDPKSVVQEVYDAANKWVAADPSVASKLTLEQIVDKVLQHSNDKWSKRFEAIQKVKAKGSKKPSKSEKPASNKDKSKSLRSDKSKEAAKVKSERKTRTLSGKNKGGNNPPKRTKWNPEMDDQAFEDAVFSEMGL